MALEISKPSNTAINHSIAVILSADRKKALSDQEITDGKRVTEQDCYGALIHNSLSTTLPKLGMRFENEIKAATEAFKKNHSGTDMYKVSDRLMRQYLREKEITPEQYRTLRSHALGHAQLDSDRTRISAEKLPDSKSGDTPLRAVSTFHKRLETNQSATTEEIAQLRAHEAEISVARWRERKKEGVISHSSTATTPSQQALGNIPTGFLWKPKSDSDGKLVVLLPPSFSASVHALTLKEPSGKILEEGRYAGIGNGGRLHFRFSKDGGSFPDGASIEITFTDGTKTQIAISETSKRIEST